VNGTHTGGGDYTVAALATLGGTGSTTSALNVSGVLSPGASIASFASGTLTMNNGSTFEYEVNSSVLPSVGADLQIVTGDLNLFSVVNLTITDLAGSPTAFANGTTFSLVNYSGTWNSGLFSFGGNAIANHDTFVAGLNTWRLDYDSTSGGSNFSGEYIAGKFVNIVAVAEPASLALLIPAAAIGAWVVRRRRGDSPQEGAADGQEDFLTVGEG
jgi:hypothetical protein